MADNNRPVTLVGPGGDEVTVTSPAAINQYRYGLGYRVKNELAPQPAVVRRKPADADASGKQG
ncbi:hypothetical protein [Pseudonocardia asaccharolytica]|uniref:Uncharacterized protein n=1 Tax=Pseudonocardia asaccharolytica DSM 44247 = NBRC 16224 TaxID=1123024 RepID=A0A511D3K7_9PSEU|nr:hypothetical protein [Pseudonocardia asaccharolytica]GEL19362.1 hypothetical protein PA7_31990 [Pseudonocardia asaccharolytica DSM 44247 = NBRC 16224]